MKSIRDMAKRFKIVLYHLNKICEDWGECRGLSACDVGDLQRFTASIKGVFTEANIAAYEDYPFIPEEEFDNEPQATTMLEEDNKRLQARIIVLEAMVEGVRMCYH